MASKLLKKILIVTDGEKYTKNAFDYEIELAKYAETKLYVIYVIDTASFPEITPDERGELEHSGDEAVKYLVDKASAEGLEVDKRIVEGQPVEEIIRYAEGNSVDFIVIGGEQEVARNLSVQIIRTSRIPVLAVSNREDSKTEDISSKLYKKILIATDGAEYTENAIDYAIELAKITEATLHALYVIDTAAFASIPMDAAWESMYERLRKEGNEATGYVADKAQAVDKYSRIREDIVEGHPDKKILEYAENNSVDIIVMGTLGKRGLDRFLLGSVAEKVVRSSKIPVLVARGKICDYREVKRKQKYAIESNEDEGLEILFFIFSFFWGTLLLLLGQLYSIPYLGSTVRDTRNLLLVLSMTLGFITAMLVYRRPKKEKK